MFKVLGPYPRRDIPSFMKTFLFLAALVEEIPGRFKNFSIVETEWETS